MNTLAQCEMTEWHGGSGEENPSKRVHWGVPLHYFMVPAQCYLLECEEGEATANVWSAWSGVHDWHWHWHQTSQNTQNSGLRLNYNSAGNWQPERSTLPTPASASQHHLYLVPKGSFAQLLSLESMPETSLEATQRHHIPRYTHPCLFTTPTSSGSD